MLSYVNYCLGERYETQKIKILIKKKRVCVSVCIYTCVHLLLSRDVRKYKTNNFNYRILSWMISNLIIQHIYNEKCVRKLEIRYAYKKISSEKKNYLYVYTERIVLLKIFQDLKI